MGDLLVLPSYKFSETDIITADKLNLAATPVVQLALETPVNDQNYFRNGNFYSSFWTTPAGVPVTPGGGWIGNADYWLCRANGAAPTYQRSTNVPDLFSLYSAQLVGAASVGIVEFGQQINGDLSATLRRPCTFSGYIQNNSGVVLSPSLEFYTCNAFNNFSAITLQTTINLQSCANGAWTYVSATQDVSLLANAANGLLIAVLLPAGALSQATMTINFSRLKFQIGELATEFSDDPSLFIQTPSIDSTMLQDGCIARPTLFAPAVIPNGAFVAGAIQSADIGAGQVAGTNLAAGAAVANLGYTPVNKAGDSGVGVVGFVNDTQAVAAGQPGIVIATTATNATNNNYDPAVGFSRPATTNPTWRYIGLAPSGRFRTVDQANKIGYLLDTVTGVDTASYQPQSITYAALAQSLINAVCPVGMVIIFAGPNAPTGWLVCDGTAYQASTYPALYAVLGTYWGGTGAIFNVPDFRGRTPIGYVNTPAGGITARAFASTGGEENHALNQNELANHNHTLTDSTHSHNYADPQHSHSLYGGWPADAPHGAGPWMLMAGAGGPGRGLSLPSSSNITINAASANISIAAVGGNAAHNNMPPFAVAYYLIKAT